MLSFIKLKYPYHIYSLSEPAEKITLYLLIFEAQKDDFVQECQVEIGPDGLTQISLAGVVQHIVASQLALHQTPSTDAI
jgi:hypothetical protein